MTTLTIKKNPIVPALCVLAAAFGVSACGGDDKSSSAAPASATTTLPQDSEPVELNPDDFSLDIDNPYWPMSPGNKWVYSETDTEGTKEDVVVEVTDDWYAQDSDGNIWYLGEYVTNYKDGKVVDHSGSFEAGVDGAQAGIAMPANPEPGLTYRQEDYQGEAEDKGAVITVGEEQVEVPFGYFNEGILMTRDLVPTEPKVEELKFYAPGVGPLLSVHTDGAGGRAVLVSFTKGG